MDGDMNFRPVAGLEEEEEEEKFDIPDNHDRQ